MLEVVVVVVVEDVLVVDADVDRGAQGLGRGSVFSLPAWVLPESGKYRFIT